MKGWDWSVGPTPVRLIFIYVFMLLLWVPLRTLGWDVASCLVGLECWHSSQATVWPSSSQRDWDGDEELHQMSYVLNEKGQWECERCPADMCEPHNHSHFQFIELVSG